MGMMKSISTTRFAKIAFLLLLLAAGATVLAMRTYGAQASFMSLVTRPIPPSVRNIKMERCRISSLRDRWEGHQERAVILRFEVSRQDLTQIVAAREFIHAYPGTYMSRVLTQIDDHWEIKLSGRARYKAPRWFDLAEWRNPEAYVLEEYVSMSAYMSTLFYNEQLGCAFLIRWEVEEDM